MSGNTKAKKNHIKRNVAIIVVVAAALIALRLTVYEAVKAKVVDAAFEKVVLNEICNSNDESSNSSSFVASGDLDSLKQFAQDNFTDSEIEELTGIYYKYAN